MEISKSMSLVAVGLNHKSAPITVRERVSFTPAKARSALNALINKDIAKEAAILSTCHRTELYLLAKNDNDIGPWLSDYHALPLSEITPHLYTYQDRQAVQHMMRVASGIDSMILGEPQIFGQMKAAWALAQREGALGAQLGRLFEHTFHAAKSVRGSTAIGEQPISLAYAAVKLAAYLFNDYQKLTVLLVGMGAMTTLVYEHLKEQGVKQFIIANRDTEKVKTWLNDLSHDVIPIAAMPANLHRADIIISATAASLPILGKGSVETALKQRKHRPMLFIDLAMPRDIEPEVASLDDVYLYNVDDLSSMVDQNLSQREKAALEADVIIHEHVEAYMRWLQTRPQVCTMTNFRDKINTLINENYQKVQKKLSNNHNVDEILSQLRHELTEKILHAPSHYLRNNPLNSDELDIVEKVLGVDKH